MKLYKSQLFIIFFLDGGENVKSSAVLERTAVDFDTMMRKLEDLYVRWILPELIHPMINVGRGNVKLRTKPLKIDWVDPAV